MYYETISAFCGTWYLSHCSARFAFNPLFVNWVTSLTLGSRDVISHVTIGTADEVGTPIVRMGWHPAGLDVIFTSTIKSIRWHVCFSGTGSPSCLGQRSLKQLWFVVVVV